MWKRKAHWMTGEVVGDVQWEPVQRRDGTYRIPYRYVRLDDGSIHEAYAPPQDVWTLLAWSPGERVRVGWEFPNASTVSPR
jgi:hypothetical protein